MYVVDITRDDDNDMLVGNNSMDAKSKTINYIKDYVLAKYNLYLDKNIIDVNLDMQNFSLKEFLKNNYDLSINKDLLIQSIITDKDNCLFVKYQDNSKTFPSVYTFNKNEEHLAKSTLSYLVNDSLIKKYEDNLEMYDKQKLDVLNPSLLNYKSKDINCEIISLYNGGLFLEELLNNATSYYDIKNQKDMGGIDI